MNEQRQALAQHRLNQAAQCLSSAQLLMDSGDLAGSANRSYYAMFYAVLALLCTKGLGTSKHAGAIALFSREFVKKGKFPAHLARWLRAAFDLRLRADYRDLFHVSSEHAGQALEHAKQFVTAVRQEMEKSWG